MDISAFYGNQLKLAREEFAHLIVAGEMLRPAGGLPQKLRLTVIDGSVIDVFLSLSGRYSYHWERRFIDGTVYRHETRHTNDGDTSKLSPSISITVLKRTTTVKQARSQTSPKRLCAGSSDSSKTNWPNFIRDTND